MWRFPSTVALWMSSKMPSLRMAHFKLFYRIFSPN